MKVVGIIPARYGSSRLPGKPLKDILGHPMIWWVYKRVCTVEKLDEVYVATDDERISSICEANEIPVVMTANTHRAAAHRLQEVSETIKADFYVQLNGDEPLINTEAVAAAIPDRVPQDVEYGTNIITEMTDPAQVMDPSNIKMVFDKHVGIIGYNKKMLDFYKNSDPGRFELIEGIDTLRFLDYGKQLKLSLVPECHSLSVDTEKDLGMVIKMMKEGNK